jgi:hypothetical protein
MSKTVHAENLHDHFGKTDEAHCHTGEASIGWLRTAVLERELETGSREYQREKVATVSWKQNIMRTVLFNRFARIPQIHMRVMTIDEGQYKFELIDGQQRTTAVLDFLNDDYPLPDNMVTYDNIKVGGLYASVLRDTAKYRIIYNRILEYRLTTLWYENLDDDQVSRLFVEVLNNTTNMNPQEMRNAIRGLFSTFVRNHARFEDMHPLFNRITVKDKKGTKTILQHLPKLTLKGRMEVDEWLTQLVYLYEHGLSKGIKNKKLNDWVRNIQQPGQFACIGSSKFKPFESRWKKHLDFAHKIVTAVNSKHKDRLTPLMAMVLVAYAHEIQKRGITVQDVRKFSDAYFGVIDKWSDTKTKLYFNETTVTGKQMPPMSELFGGKNENAIATIVKILDKELNANSKAFGLIELDPRETFTKKDIIRKWKEQDYKCFYTGEELDQDDIAGDHYIPRSAGIEKGGVTEYSNLVVTSEYHNLRKLHKHGDDYLKEVSNG